MVFSFAHIWNVCRYKSFETNVGTYTPPIDFLILVQRYAEMYPQHRVFCALIRILIFPPDSDIHLHRLPVLVKLSFQSAYPFTVQFLAVALTRGLFHAMDSFMEAYSFFACFALGAGLTFLA